MALQVGGETQAYCTSCKTMREHIIVAMVGTRPAKVECDECHKQHLYRAAPPAAKDATGATTKTRTTKPRSRSSTPTPPLVDVTALIAGRQSNPYSPSTRFGMGDVVQHPSFGIGIVVAHPGPQKMEVAFTSGTKLLQHDRAAAPTSTLVRPPPRAEDERPAVTDAPPPRPR